MSGVQMSDFISKIGHLDPRFYSLIYCDTGGPDVGGPDVGGPDVGGPDVGGPDVRFPKKLYNNCIQTVLNYVINVSTYCLEKIHASR